MSVEIEGGWDDPEIVPQELPAVTGAAWVLVPRKSNVFGADVEVWGSERPPLTSRLRSTLHPYELAHFEGDTFRERLLDFTARSMRRRRLEGCEPEDVLSVALEAMLTLAECNGWVPGSPEWMRVAQVVIRRRITDLLRLEGGRPGTSRHERTSTLMYGEYIARRATRPFESSDPEDDVVDQDPLSHLHAPDFVPQVLSDELIGWIAAACTRSEGYALVEFYQEDRSCSQIAEEMGITENAVKMLLRKGRDKLKETPNGALNR